MEPTPFLTTTLRGRFARWARAHKPAAPVRVHVLLAALTWTLVGTGLAVAGARWCLDANGAAAVLLLGGGAAAGLAKGRFLLAPLAQRNGGRLASRGDGYCLGGFQTARSWALVAGMMGAGVLLRHSGLPRPALGLLYSAVGAALLVGSVPLWRRVRTPGG